MSDTLKTPSHHEIRDELQCMVINDLLGPAGGPEEEVDEPKVTDRYILGTLAPRRTQTEAIENDDANIDAHDTIEDGMPELETNTAGSIMPSSFGMSFCTAGDAKEIQINAKWGNYTKINSETLVTDKGNPKQVWKRCQVDVTSSPVPLQDGSIERFAINPDQEDVYVQGLIRQLDGHFVITVFLVNGQHSTQKNSDSTWLFQPELTVQSPDGEAIFRKRTYLHNPHKRDAVLHSEEMRMEMLYRHKVEYAVGHGVSVHAEAHQEDETKAVSIRTTAVPTFEVPKQTPPDASDIPALGSMVLDMKELSETKDTEFTTKLGSLPTAYKDWVAEERKKIGDAAQKLDHYHEAAQASLKDCETALERIQEGIDLLSSRKDAAEAFRFANRAMYLQRIHSIYAQQIRSGKETTLDEHDQPNNRRWYPFQLAFVLMNLPALTDLHHKDRIDTPDAVADLLWFPTGGGKTEAYLGLSAYALGIRRLQGMVEGHSGEHGLAVLMRYTLRLLTLQQFQRAAALICACEVIRKEDEQKWGGYPFRLGLWVGMRTTPNNTKQCKEALDRDHDYRSSTFSPVGDPIQITYCPWCGSSIDPGRNQVQVDTTLERTFFHCSNGRGKCDFSSKMSDEGIPILVVDQEIYRNPPAMMIATVDKFAQMPWKGEIQTLFGKITGLCTRHGFRSPDIKDSNSHPRWRTYEKAETIDFPSLRPPDLIIQDELHLISGPLGSMVGLYETAVDELCSWTVDGKKIRPKIIASTATIRQAADQIHQVFNRKTHVFPPQGTDIRDNFFSIQREPSEKYPGRRYLGICAPGKRNKAVTIRVYMALMAAAKTLYEKYGKAVDPWMTLVGYFNSMRELGGTRRLVDDDITNRMPRMEQRGFSSRFINKVEELNSRKGASDIPRVLDAIEVEFDPAMEDIRKQQYKDKNSQNFLPSPIDVLLATNMISVGVDVSRLGLMVVNNQPKSTAEYIQASSRVGRRYPGLVCTVYNWARPRDVSHYEQFEHYHATFYKQVEALSVTPFAARAIDRGLSALLVSLIRLADDEYNGNHSASTLDDTHEVVSNAIESITNRVEQVAGSKSVSEETKKRLRSLLDIWLKEARQREGGSVLGYKRDFQDTTVPLLQNAGGEWTHFTCLNSLRGVEETSLLILDDTEMDNE